MSKDLWSKNVRAKVQQILGSHSDLGAALKEISSTLGRSVTQAELQSAFVLRGDAAPASFLKQPEKREAVVPAPAALTSAERRRARDAARRAKKRAEKEEAKGQTEKTVAVPTKASAPPVSSVSSGKGKGGGLNLSEDVQRLLSLTKKGAPTEFSDLCDKLNLSPAKVKVLIKEAQNLGMNIHVEHDHVGIRSPPPDERVQDVKIAPVVGTRQKVGVISDTHLGSKYCLREQLKEFVHYAYSQGVREILHPGDVLEGNYPHAMWEVSHVGLDDQTQDLFETLPQLPGLKYFFIQGNHDNRLSDSCGVDAGHFIVNYFASRGRHDLQYLGNRGAYLKLRGAVIELWHPRSGVGYAKSYPVQRHIAAYTSIHPQILLCGHWHTFVYTVDRGTHGIACPTMQGGGSAFSKSLGGAPSIGGLILSWGVTVHGTIREFTIENRSYYEREQPVEIQNVMEATPILGKRST